MRVASCLAVLLLASCSPARLQLDVPSLDTDALVTADEVTIRSTGDVVLRGGVKAGRLEVRARSFAVQGRFEVGTAHIKADDHAITFSAPTTVQGSISDVDDIVLTGAAQLTLTGDTVLRSDADGDGVGRLDMQPGSALRGPHRLRVEASGRSSVQGIEVSALELIAATPCATFTAAAPIQAGDFTLTGATLELGAPARLSGATITVDGTVRSTSTIDFSGAGAQAVTVGASTFGPFTHSGAGALSFTSRYTRRVPVSLPVVDAGVALEQLPVPIVIRDAGHEIFAGSEVLSVTDARHRALPFEVEAFDRTRGELVVWTTLPRLEPSRENTVWLTFGAAEDHRCNRPTEVWGDDFVAVYHFGEADGGAALDSTRYGHHALAQGTTAGAGRVGLGRAIQGGERLRIAATPALKTPALSIEVHASPNGLSGPGLGGNRLVDRSWVAQPGGWSLFVWEARMVSFNGMNDAGVRSGFHVPSIFGLDRWFSAGATIDTASARAFVDGRPGTDVAITLDGGFVLETDTDFCLSSCYSWDAFTGVLDEVRLSRVARNPSWMSYAAQVVAAPPLVGPTEPHVFDLPNGMACHPEAACRSGFCVDAVCCERECGPCERCDAPGFEGTCRPVLSAADPDSCAACDETGACATPADGGSDAGDAGPEPYDAGVGGAPKYAVGCGCASTEGLLAVGAVASLALRRRRRTRRGLISG